jgi:hypothetical protein
MGPGDERHGGGTGSGERDAAATTEVRKPFDWAAYCRSRGRSRGWRALLGEDPAEIDGLYEHWFAAFQPKGPAQCFMIEMVVSDLIQLRRCRACLAAIERGLIEETRERFRAGQREELAQLQAQLLQDPAGAVAGLKQFALGCRWLIECWEWLGRFLERAQGHDPVQWYGLGPWFDRHKKSVLGYYAANGSMGPGIDPSSESAPPAGSLERLRAVMEWELPRLRVLYERLEAEGYSPAEDEAIAAALANDAKCAEVLRTQRDWQKNFEKDYRFLLKHHDGPLPPDLPGLPPGVEPPRPKRARRR